MEDHRPAGLDLETLTLRDGAKARPITREDGAPRPGEILVGRYVLEAELGRGAFARVYRARDNVAKETVAIKLTALGSVAAAELDRLRRELKIARLVNHPAVVRIHDLAIVGERVALIMELVDGRTLTDLLAERRLDAAEILALARKLAAGLEALHTAGIVHRDLKPGNILLRRSSGDPVITDFGVSRLAQERASTAEDGDRDPSLVSTRDGDLVGTPTFMAPEQLEGRTDVQATADVYAFGLIMYQCCVGALPHASAERRELLELRRRPAPPLASSRKDLPSWFCGLVDRCLRPESLERPRDGRALREALSPRRRGRIAAVAVAAGAAVALIAAALVIMRGGAPARTEWRPSVRRLTFARENLDHPAFSPDGRRIVIASTRETGDWNIWVGDADGTTWQPVTSDREIDLAPVFVDGGRSALFFSVRDGTPGLYRIRLGSSEPPELVVRAIGSRFATSDGRHVLFRRSERGWAMLDADTGEVRDAFQLSAEGWPLDVAVSADGRWAAIAIARNEWAQADVVRVDLATGTERFLGLPHHVASVTFSPEEPNVLIVASRRGAGQTLWKYRDDGRPPIMLLGWSDAAVYAPMVSRDGKKLLFSHDRTTGQLFARSPGSPTWETQTNDLLVHAHLELDGGRLYHIVSDRGDPKRTIRAAPWPYRRAAETTFGAWDQVAAFAISTKADVLALVLHRADRFELTRARADGSGEHRLIDLDAATGLCGSVSISADGRHIAFASFTGKPGLFVIPSTGGELVQLTDTPSCNARFSPIDPDQLAFARIGFENGNRIEIMNVSKRAARQVADLPHRIAQPIAWTPDGNALITVSEATDVVTISVADGKVLEKSRAPGDTIEWLAAGADGSVIVTSVVADARLHVIDNFGDSPR